MDAVPKSRLSLLSAAWVIARRDFTAILFSRAFFFFLLGPLFPLIVGGLAGGIGSAVDRELGSTGDRHRHDFARCRRDAEGAD